MIYIGIDWGTHSSKVYTFDSRTNTGTLGSIIDSTLYFSKQREIVGISEGFRNMGEEDFLPNHFPIKRQMILNPNISFWEGKSDDTNLTLGASITLSLLALLREAIKDIGSENRNKIADICFSFPNWSPELDINHNIAQRKFRQAAYFAVSIAMDGKYDEIIPQNGVSNTVFLELISSLQPSNVFSPLEMDKITQIKDPVDDKLSLSYLPESLAAGIPYLLYLQREANHAYRLLVIDVGAGSTDIGYLTQWRLTKNDPFHMVYFKPAPAISLAGESITEAVAKKFNLTRHEAENRKIELTNLGKLNEQVRYVREEWIPTIAGRVFEYISSLPKHVLMEKPAPVQIIVTGGSGAIPELIQAILEKVEAGLKANGNKPRYCPPSALRAENTEINLYPNIDAFETGRRSVSIGAGQPNKSKLIFA
jgi:hypothetical protein